MSVVWPNGKGVLGGTCPECGGQIMLHWKDKVSAEYYCMECGMILQHAGYRQVDNVELRKIIAEVFKELEAKGNGTIKLQPFVHVCDALSRALYGRPIRTISLGDLDALGLETYCGQVYRKKTQHYSVHDVSKGGKQ